MRVILGGILLALGSVWAQGQSPRSSDLDAQILTGIDRLLLQDYSGATAQFREVATAFPDHPAGYLLQAGVVQTVAMDYEQRLDRRAFDSLLVLAREKADRMITDSPREALGHFYRGSVLGYQSVADASEGDWFGAAANAMSSVSAFEEALVYDSTLVDAKMGIGTYYYWKSRQMAFLNWLPFVADRREQGISLIEETMTGGRYNRHAAMSSLISILLDAERYDRAVETSERALADYPGNRLFLWGLATGHERLGHSARARAAYRRLLGSISGDATPNPYNELVCRVNLARLELAAGEKEEARSLLVPVLGRSPEDYATHLHDRATKKLQEARDLAAALARR